MFKDKKIGDPVENVSTRLTVRSLIRAIELFNGERYKSRRSIDDIKYLIEKIHGYEKRYYSKHLYPFIVNNENTYILDMLINNNLYVKNTWGLYLAFLKKNDYLIDLLISEWGYVHESDILPMIWGCYLSNRKFWIKDCRIVEFTKKNIQNLANMNMVISEIKYWTYYYLKDVIWGDEREEALEEIRKMHLWCSDEEFPPEDRMEFVIKAYGIVKWGFIESI